MSNARVACTAKDAADVASLVAMVNVQTLYFRLGQPTELAMVDRLELLQLRTVEFVRSLALLSPCFQVVIMGAHFFDMKKDKE